MKKNTILLILTIAPYISVTQAKSINEPDDIVHIEFENVENHSVRWWKIETILKGISAAGYKKADINGFKWNYCCGFCQMSNEFHDLGTNEFFFDSKTIVVEKIQQWCDNNHKYQVRVSFGRCVELSQIKEIIDIFYQNNMKPHLTTLTGQGYYKVKLDCLAIKKKPNNRAIDAHD